MPNQPKTPARTIRLSDETMTKVDNMQTALGTANRSETIRASVEMAHGAASAAESMRVFAGALAEGLPEGISIEAMAAAEGVNLDAIHAADAASWLNVRMDTPEANRRLLAALSAARPFLIEAAVEAERKRTLLDVITRAEGYEGKISQVFLDDLRSLV